MLLKKSDRLISFFLFGFILFVSIFCLDNTCYWGDDFAAYISEGIAIADGCFDRQIMLNARMHPSELPDEALGGTLVYVWGYPLVLGLIYKLCGFDRVHFASLIYYKLPSAFALALLALVLYLFLRRRFGQPLSLALSLLFCANYEFRVFMNTLYSDLFFLFFVLLSFYLTEIFLDCDRRSTRTAAGIALGISLWFTYETRLNGISVLLACAAACVIRFFSLRKSLKKEPFLPLLIPFALFVLLKLVSEAILAPATANTSDLEGFRLATLWGNLTAYYACAREWLGLIWDDLFFNRMNQYLPLLTSSGEDTYGVIAAFCGKLKAGCLACTFLFCLIGFFESGVRREKHLTLFTLGYLLIVCLLPYNQGVRYIYPVLVLFPMYTGYGLTFLGHLFSRLLRLQGRKRPAAGTLISALLCLLMMTTAVKSVFYYRENPTVVVPTGPEDFYKMQAYTPCAKETYRYIMENTPEDCIIGFFKPRALYLNTQRISIRTDINGHSLNDVDYFLSSLHVGEEELAADLENVFTPVFSNAEFVLYQKQ